MKRYFDGLVTVEEIKAHFRRLAIQHHPDKGGDVRIMQAINQQYHEALQRCDGQTRDDNGKQYRYRYEQEVEQAVMDKIAALVALGADDITIALIGTWVWVTGNTRARKDQLKTLGLKWHKDREAWFFAAKPWHGGRSRASLAGLAQRYGCREFAAQQREKLERAAA